MVALFNVEVCSIGSAKSTPNSNVGNAQRIPDKECAQDEVIIDFLKGYGDLFKVTREQSCERKIDPIFLLYSLLLMLK